MRLPHGVGTLDIDIEAHDSRYEVVVASDEVLASLDNFARLCWRAVQVVVVADHHCCPKSHGGSHTVAGSLDR